MLNMQIEILDAKSQKRLFVLENINSEDTIESLKNEIAQKKPSLYVERQALRLEPRGKALKDEETVGALNLPQRGAQLYLRDLGAQIGWKTVFLIEYAGPLFIYPLFYLRPTLVYGSAASLPIHWAVKAALICWSVHYAKRLYETAFVHRFSHGTMPFRNVFKNSGYYWGFTAFVSYFVNHPHYTPASFGCAQIIAGLVTFAIAEVGNYSIHTLLRDLRPSGSKERRIPRPNGNPLTGLFNLVSCPNYTYEVAAWLAFSVATQSLPAFIFMLAGFAQMSIWAQGKHRNYRREFTDYPRNRKAIIPFVL